MENIDLFRRAGRLLAATGIGLAILAGSGTAASAMPCGPIKDPNTGHVIGWVLCREVYNHRIEPDPCLCPDPYILDDYQQWVVQEEVSVGQQPIGEQLGGAGLVAAR
ncbi:MAG: hypothetical protein ACRDJN_32400 [Chloroflexota bacterium]